MKEIYAWVPWFQELAKKIAEGGEADLIEKAKKVNWVKDTPALLQYGDENIDPFSFFYFLANKNTVKQRELVYESVSEVFGIDSEISQNLFHKESMGTDGWIFPTPIPIASALFHYDGNGNPDLLWRLFRQAVKPSANINANDFANVLKIEKVGVPKLTQCLFLINPYCFMPVDKGILQFHHAMQLPSIKNAEQQIKQSNGWEYYKDTMLKGFRSAFPECATYEINTALYLMVGWRNAGVAIGEKFFQVSTRADGLRANDYWKEFSEGNHVRTGGQASGVSFSDETSNRPYPIAEPSKGDIILVRTGNKGRAVGMVYKNDYAYAQKEGEKFTKEHKIHVLWLNKYYSPELSRNCRWDGFSSVADSDGTYKAFADTDSYGPTFELIRHISGKPGNGHNQDKVEDQNEEYELSNNEEQIKHPLNQILYGPPGTGKTWNTVNYALAIIEGKLVEDVEKEDRNLVKQRFDELKQSRQIEMVTFHQNFAYEDFIEGIRPVLGDNAGDDSGNVHYKIVDGVFKSIADSANNNLTQSNRRDTEIDMDALLEAFAENIEERLDNGKEIKFRRQGAKIDLKIIKVNRRSNGKFRSVSVCTANSTNTGEHGRGLARRIVERDYEKFYNQEIESHHDIQPSHSRSIKKHPKSRLYFALYEQIKKFHDTWSLEEQQNNQADKKKRNYVLIIDEINRGNIAKIFGELITLIEEDKRIGNEEEMTVTLPCSSNNEDGIEAFGVPNNLYIIGTMNTADRSIALLDTALRRRFDFIEMMPNPNLSLIPNDIEGVDCRKLLQVINKRITILLDREHQIGHSYFIGVDSMAGLADAFKKKIMPLLQEYFYDDWAKIMLVLNNNGFITRTKIENGLFKRTDANAELVDTDRWIYAVIGAGSAEWENPERYKEIYDNNTTQTPSDNENGE